MKNDPKRMAAALAQMGRKGDSHLAHLNKREMELLHRATDGGTVNPKTGLLEFNEEDGSPDAAGDYGSGDYFGGGDSYSYPDSQDSGFPDQFIDYAPGVAPPEPDQFIGFDPSSEPIAIGGGAPSAYDAQFQQNYPRFENQSDGATPGGGLGERSILDGWGPTIGSIGGGILGTIVGGPIGGAIGSSAGRYIGGGSAAGSAGSLIGSALGAANPLLGVALSSAGGRMGDYASANSRALSPQPMIADAGGMAGGDSYQGNSNSAFNSIDSSAEPSDAGGAVQLGGGASVATPVGATGSGGGGGYGGRFRPFETSNWSGVGNQLTSPPPVTVQMADLLKAWRA